MLAVIGFILTIAILVVIHEFGHYLFARIFKVKVLTFSVGFGPKLIKWQGKHNQWCISAIPLGGYVEMLDERNAPVAPEQKALAYNNKPPLQKLLIAFAGPLFNILFAFFAYYALGLYGVATLKPQIESVQPTPLVKNLAAIQPNSLIQKINDHPVTSWSDAEDKFAAAAVTSSQITLNLSHAAHTAVVRLDLSRYLANEDNLSLIGLGLYPFEYLPQISYIEPQSPAANAGLREGDRLIAINGKKTNSWFDFSQQIRNAPSEKLTLTVERKNQLKQIIIVPESITDDNGQIIGKIGIMPTLNAQLLESNSYIKRYGIIDSIPYAYSACLSMLSGNLKMLQYMLNGKVSWHNLGGPVTIAKASQGALHQGVKAFIDLLALISLSLAIMNLLPIPVLDGGHILIYAIEWLRGKPLELPIQQLLFKIGLVFVLGVTGLALYNDILKLLNL